MSSDRAHRHKWQDRLLAASLLWLVLPAHAQAAPSEDAQLEGARQIVARGEQLFSAGNYDAALSEFTRAYDLLEGHPRQYFVLHNQALCHERMFRYDLALQLYERYLQTAPASEPDRAAVSAVVETLRGLLATVEIESNVPADVWVDDRQVGSAPGRVLVPAGRHVVELRASLHESARSELNVGARQHARLRFSLQRLSTYSGLHRAYFWSGVGLTAAAAITGSIFGARALDARDDLRVVARESRDRAEASERVRDLSLAADVCFGAAAVLAVGSTVLYFVTDWGDETERAPGKTLVVAPGAIGGRF